MRPHTGEARQQIFILRELDLKLTLSRLRPLREYIEDEPGAVHDLYAQLLGEHAHLRGRELVIEYRERDGVHFDEFLHLPDLAVTDEAARVGRGAILDQNGNSVYRYDYSDFPNIDLTEEVLKELEEYPKKVLMIVDTDLKIGETYTIMVNDEEYKQITIEEGITSIGNSVFAMCGKMESVMIPDSVVSIGKYAFQYCNVLTSVTLPKNIEVISDFVFYSCKNLTAVIIPDSVTKIGQQAFKYCSSPQRRRQYRFKRLAV